MRRINLCLLFSLWSATGRAEGDPPAGRQEAYLLHQSVDLAPLDRWDPADKAFRPLRSGDGPTAQARVLVIHLWADWCPPCVKELPALRELSRQVGNDYGGQVQFLFVTETHEVEKLRRYLENNPQTFPAATLYHDSNGRLAEGLGQALPAPLGLPATLLLDRDRVVRQALVGPVLQRRGELVNGIARLLAVQGGKDRERR